MSLVGKTVNQQQDSTFRNLVSAVCLSLLVTIPLLQAFRGLDMTDMGFLLTNQRLIFSHPESVSYWFHLWLTNITGGLVDLLFGGFGVLPHKFTAAVIFWGTAAGIFLLYRHSIGREIILLAVAASMAFVFMYKINIVHYNNLSALCYVFGGVLLSEAVVRRQVWLFTFSGFLLGLNAFVRMPNIVGLGLIFVPILLDLLTNDPSRKSRIGFKAVVFFFLGAFFAAAAAFLALAVLGHLRIYLASLWDLSESSERDVGNYSLIKLILIPMRDIVYSLVYGLPVAVSFAVASALVSLLKKRWLRIAAGFLIAGIVYGLVVGPIWKATGLATSLRLIYRATAGVCYWAILVILFDRHADSRLRFTAVLTACISLALNVGSDTGINVSTYVFPAMFPALLAAGESFARTSGRFLKTTWLRSFVSLPLVVAAFFMGVSGYVIKNIVYRDMPQMHRMVDYPQLRGVFTSEARAQILEESIPVISAYVPPGSILFAFDSLPLLHFALRTRPYLGNAWPAQYDPRYLDTLLKREERQAPLPVVVLAKSNPRWSTWPANSAPPVHTEPVEAFLVRNQYGMAWENSAFELYLPPSR